MIKPLILVSNRIKSVEDYRIEVAGDLSPRLDYMEIAHRLCAEPLGYRRNGSAWSAGLSKFEHKIRLDISEAYDALPKLPQCSAILSTSERAAIPLAIYMTFTQQKMPHVLIAHRLTSPNKTRLFKICQLHRSLAHIICVSKAQAEFAIAQLGVSSSQVDFIYDKVDQRFYRPLKVEPQNFILAVGQEQRDYATLVKAVAGTGIKLVIVASSPWSSFELDNNQLSGVTVQSHISYTNLRMLYANARLVVVPLFDVDYAAGSNTVLESMAMGKALIVSRTRGIKDYVVDDETGVNVTSGDPVALREVILDLWNNPRKLDRLGSNARQAVLDRMNIDRYVDGVVQIMGDVMQESRLSTASTTKSIIPD
jgi:glycosyltransferase involved in cell wall biosynthesis